MSGKFHIVSRHKINQRFRPLYFFGMKNGESMWGNDQQTPPTFERNEADALVSQIADKHVKTRELVVVPVAVD